jgi:uncharacterized membrane protein
MQPEQRPQTLDGLAFAQQYMPRHYEILQWIRENTSANDILLEPAGGAYQKEENFFSAFSGRATLVGWRNHEGLWRPKQFQYNNPEAVGNQRVQDSYTFFTTQDWNTAKAILQKHNVKYIAYAPPTNPEIRQRLATIPHAVYRDHLQPVFPGAGNGTTPELYKVPDAILEENK